MRIIFVFCVLFLLNGCAVSKATSEKINGVSFVAAREAIEDTHTNPVVNVGANYAAIMPFGFLKNLDHPEIIHNTDRQWFGETRSGGKQYIEELRKKDIKIIQEFLDKAPKHEGNLFRTQSWYGPVNGPGDQTMLFLKMKVQKLEQLKRH